MINKNTQYNGFQDDSRVGVSEQGYSSGFGMGSISGFRIEVVAGFWGQCQISRRGSGSDFGISHKVGFRNRDRGWVWFQNSGRWSSFGIEVGVRVGVVFRDGGKG